MSKELKQNDDADAVIRCHFPSKLFLPITPGLVHTTSPFQPEKYLDVSAAFHGLNTSTHMIFSASGYLIDLSNHGTVQSSRGGTISKRTVYRQPRGGLALHKLPVDKEWNALGGRG